MIAVTNRLPVYEVDGKRVESSTDEDCPVLRVASHWNEDSKVVIDLAPEGEGNEHHKVTVSARDLLAAVNNATNINRH